MAKQLDPKELVTFKDALLSEIIQSEVYVFKWFWTDGIKCPERDLI